MPFGRKTQGVSFAGFGTQREAMLNAMTEEIVKSSEIEGEILNSEQVRSSLARHLNTSSYLADFESEAMRAREEARDPRNLHGPFASADKMIASLRRKK